MLAEVFRAGVASLPRGQSEAAYALGMRKTQVMTNVLLPQALRAMLPTIVSQLVVVLKDTALGFLILYPELLYQARTLGSQGQLGSPILPVAMVIAAIYIDLPSSLPGRAPPRGPPPRRPGGGARRPRSTPPPPTGAPPRPPPTDRPPFHPPPPPPPLLLAQVELLDLARRGLRQLVRTRSPSAPCSGRCGRARGRSAPPR